MPRGPPPPSPSYTWKFDGTVTDDESTDSGDQIVASRISEETIVQGDSPSIEQYVEDVKGVDRNVRQEDKPEEREEPADEVDSEWGSWAAIIPSASKHKQSGKHRNNNNNKSKKNKNRKKKKQQQQQQQPKEKIVKKKSLCFGTVRIQQYERCLGVDVVPLDGSWPLGIGDPLVETTIQEISVDQYEDQKQKRLQDRLARLGDTVLAQDLLSARRSQRYNNSHNDDDVVVVLETRQWDYRSSAKNPLFHLVTESSRMELLLRYSAPDSHDAVVPLVDNHTKGPPCTNGSRQRKQLTSSSSSSSRRDSHFVERFNDLFTKADVSHFRVQLEDIRAMRSIKDATGCSCHRLKVYLPPEQGAGKTAQKKRLAVTKLKSELRKRNLLPIKDTNHDNNTHTAAATPSREELERILHDAVEKEGCCDYDCPCYQNGIGCQSDACDCWQQSSKENNTSMTTQDIRDRCGNRHGMYTVDIIVIDEYRRNVLEKLTYCPPVQDEDHITFDAPPQALSSNQNNKFFGRKLSKLAT